MMIGCAEQDVRLIEIIARHLRMSADGTRDHEDAQSCTSTLKREAATSCGMITARTLPETSDSRHPAES
jgi:hypothetical protein